MAQTPHQGAIHHLPPFVTAPGEGDGLFVFTAIFLLLAVVGIGVFYFKLHALPEQLAHRGQKAQFQLVSVLALIALFTHNHAFWIAGLLIAVVPLPDFKTPMTSIATSLGRIAEAAAPAGQRPHISPESAAATPTQVTPAGGEPRQHGAKCDA